jgi:mannosyltransferase OCH1-like enzyme
MSIPKDIYICYKNLHQLKKYANNWKKLNPEWTLKLYDDQMCRDFLLQKYGKLHREVFDFIKDGPIKADFWRVCVLHTYGGLYVDADIEPVKPLNSYLESTDDFVTCISSEMPNYPDHHLNPHFIYCAKNNHILQGCIQHYLYLYTAKKPYSYVEWGIVLIMLKMPIFKHIVKGKSSQVVRYQGQTYKFLLEFNFDTCLYGDEVVLYNHYRDYVNHEFKTS